MINCVHIVRAIGRSGSYVLGSIVFAITLVAAHGQAVPAIDHNSGGTERINRATVLKMHQNLVSSVANGTNPDDRLSQTLAKDYPDKLTTKTVHTESVESYGRKVPLSYMEAIARTEELLKESGLRVTVEIQASPRSCNIRYQPVIGGPVLKVGSCWAHSLANSDNAASRARASAPRLVSWVPTVSMLCGQRCARC